MDRRSVTTAQAAEMLGVTAQTIQKWVDAGHLSAWRTVGGHRRVDAESVERMVAAREQAMRPAADECSVMLVEDNPLVGMVLRAQVEELLPKAKVQLIGNGFAALLEIGRHPPDLLITDINLPGLDGLAMLRQLRADNATQAMPVILVTSYDATQVASFGPIPNDVPLLRKPVEPELLGPLILAMTRPRAAR